MFSSDRAKKGLRRHIDIFFRIFSIHFQAITHRGLAFPWGPGGFIKVREAGRNHFDLSWYL